MCAFIVLRKSNEKGSEMNSERWNTKYIRTYRKWATEDKKELSVVYVEETAACPKGRLIVDNTVEELDAACGVAITKTKEK